MQALGNDFMVVDGITQKVFFNPEVIRQLADRHFGVGFDQLLLVEPPYDPDVDFHYRIFNADGSETQQCANGARCLARFARLKGLSHKDRMSVSTQHGQITLTLEKDHQVTVNLGVPQFEPAQIPFKAQKAEKTYLVPSAIQTVLCGVVGLGNAHCIVEVKELKADIHSRLAAELTQHERFPNRVNVGFMQVLNGREIKLRSFHCHGEEVLASGTNACAAAIMGMYWGRLSERVQVQFAHGSLTVAWQGPGKPVFMTGSAEHVFDGQVNL
ncbi:diaminopimelate epimerase [Oceanisphaera avium]|uniref:Diaminopimelate epimerase n=1 Tax=Oceanisphaera avium TaxID=1903694 RepID=A0A1Y0CYQ9_9GAMM|nr:diaminopimelate epimerase [Oceanisphaera avium]